MELITLAPDFSMDKMIDEFVSVIWTERYSTKGEVQLVVEPTSEHVSALREGTFLGLRGSADVMQIETARIEEGLLKVNGTDLLGFLDNRLVWHVDSSKIGTADEVNPIQDWVMEDADPVAAIASVVQEMVANWSTFMSFPNHAGAGIDYDKEYIQGLTTSHAGELPPRRLTFVNGPLYGSIAQVAQAEGVGIRMYCSSPGDPPDLQFLSYLGDDRSSQQDSYELVRLSPQLDNVSGISEIRSIQEWKNVCYVVYKDRIAGKYISPDTPGYPEEPTGFNRRVMVTNADGDPPGHKKSVLTRRILDTGAGYDYTYTEVNEVDLPAFLEQNARDAFANHNYIRALDGEVSPEGLKIGVNYNLGDIIELESLSGIIQAARVTEHIRSQDASGEKEYPTISII